MLGKKLSEIKTDYAHIKDKTNLKAENLSIKFNDPFYTDLKQVSFDVREGEIFGIAGVAGNGQSELMNLLTGEGVDGVSGTLTYNSIDIKNFNPKKRRDMSIAFVPENRLGHSAVPELTLSENILISQFPNNNFITKGMINHRNIDAQAKKVIDEFNVITPGIDAKASSLSGGNLQKFVIGREILTNPKLLIISHPTWGIDAGAEHSIRKSLIELAKNGTSIIVISQDLDELFEISHRISVIFNGKLSRSYETKNISVSEIGLLMGGQGID
jgi:simple sugar transport system ATP-binding protein